jgi:hypothetical protein
MNDFDASQLNPGIRRTVCWLRSLGFDTCDSGDGQTHEHECDRPYAYVSMRGRQEDADRLRRVLMHSGIPVLSSTEAWGQDGAEQPLGVHIAYSYDPANGIGIVDLVGLRDEMLPAGVDGLFPHPYVAVGGVTIRLATPSEEDFPGGAYGVCRSRDGGSEILVRSDLPLPGQLIALIHEGIHFVDESFGGKDGEEYVEGLAYWLANTLCSLGLISRVTKEDFMQFLVDEGVTMYTEKEGSDQ